MTDSTDSSDPAPQYNDPWTLTQAEKEVWAIGKADQLIANEIAIQSRMWGEAPSQRKSDHREMMAAAMAQLDLVELKSHGLESHTAVKLARTDFYSPEWDPNAFRDYGTAVANLVVAAAYIRNEIVRRLAAGEEYGRAPRQMPYVKAEPAMSSEEAANAR